MVTLKGKLGPRNEVVKKKLHIFKGTCYNYGQFGHMAHGCKMPSGENPRMANMVEEIAMISDIMGMISEVNRGSNSKEWWVDTGAYRHVCTNKSLFVSSKWAMDDRKSQSFRAVGTTVGGLYRLSLWDGSKEIIEESGDESVGDSNSI